MKILSILIVIIVSISGVANLHKPKSSVAKADIDLLVRAIVKDIASQELSKDEVRAKTHEALSHLDQVIQSIAIEKKVIVLNSKAVLSSAPGIDLTNEIATKFNERGTND